MLAPRLHSGGGINKSLNLLRRGKNYGFSHIPYHLDDCGYCHRRVDGKIKQIQTRTSCDLGPYTHPLPCRSHLWVTKGHFLSSKDDLLVMKWSQAGAYSYSRPEGQEATPGCRQKTYLCFNTIIELWATPTVCLEAVFALTEGIVFPILPLVISAFLQK